MWISIIVHRQFSKHVAMEMVEKNTVENVNGKCVKTQECLNSVLTSVLRMKLQQPQIYVRGLLSTF